MLTAGGGPRRLRPGRRGRGRATRCASAGLGAAPPVRRSTRPSPSSCSTARPASSAAAARWPATTCSTSAPSRWSAAGTTRGSACSATAPWRRRSAPRAASAWPPARPARSGPRRRRRPIVRRVETTCPYCGVGCGITPARYATTGGSPCMADDVPANRSSARHALREGPLRHRLRPRARPHHDAAGQARRRAGTRPSLGRGARRRRRRAGAQPRAASARSPRAKATNEDGYVIQKLCRVVMGTNNVDHCTRLCHSPSVEAMLVVDGLGRDVELLPGLRGGRLPHGGRGGRLRQPPGDRDPLPPRGGAGRAPHRGQPQARGALRPGRPLDPPAAGHRRGPLQRDGARDPGRGPRRPRLRPRAHRGLRRLARPRSSPTRWSTPRRSPGVPARTSPRPPAGTRGRPSRAPA